MAIEVKLLTTQGTLEDISHLADTRKRVVRVDREALSRMLIDYDVMRGALRSAQFKVTEPQAKRERLRSE